jgi:hypothetical protein
MWGLVGARLAGTGREASEVPRRTAVVLFPAMILLHAIFIRALAPELQKANLYAAGVALVCGFGFRWLRRATTIFGIIALLGIFTFIYMFGVAAPLSYLVAIGHHQWLPWAAPISVSVLGTLLVASARLSLQRDWSKPLDQTPGVHIATQDWILWREFGSETPRSNVVAAFVALAFILAFAFLRDSSHELLLALCAGPICVALLMTDAVARMLGFYIAVHRWEAQHNIRLQVPRLAPRRRERQIHRGERNRRRR